MSEARSWSNTLLCAAEGEQDMVALFIIFFFFCNFVLLYGRVPQLYHLCILPSFPFLL